MSLKHCSKCKEFKSLSSFHSCKSKKDGLQNICKECHKIRMRSEEGRKRNYKSKLKLKYNLTLTSYENLLQVQQNRCKICKELTDVLCVDHNHLDNKVRGLLCIPCNKGLGMFKDNPEILLNAFNYLKEEGFYG